MVPEISKTVSYWITGSRFTFSAHIVHRGFKYHHPATKHRRRAKIIFIPQFMLIQGWKYFIDI